MISNLVRTFEQSIFNEIHTTYTSRSRARYVYFLLVERSELERKLALIGCNCAHAQCVHMRLGSESGRLEVWSAHMGI